MTAITTDRVDFIDGEAHELDAILSLLEVSSQALANTDGDPNVSTEHYCQAFKGVAMMVKSVRERLDAMKEAADAMFEELSAAASRAQPDTPPKAGKAA